MYDKMFFQIIPNKLTSHTNVLVNALIKKVFTYNVASSGYIFKFIINLLVPTPPTISKQKSNCRKFCNSSKGSLK